MNFTNWALQTSPKFTIGVKYVFVQIKNAEIRNTLRPQTRLYLRNFKKNIYSWTLIWTTDIQLFVLVLKQLGYWDKYTTCHKSLSTFLRLPEVNCFLLKYGGEGWLGYPDLWSGQKPWWNWYLTPVVNFGEDPEDPVSRIHSPHLLGSFQIF